MCDEKTGFEGSYTARSEIKEYYVTISEYSAKYFTLYNDRTARASTNFLSEHISAYGAPKDYQAMLNHGTLNWLNATN